MSSLDWRVFHGTVLCLIQGSEAAARPVPWGSLYSSPTGGGGSHSLYSLEEA